MKTKRNVLYLKWFPNHSNFSFVFVLIEADMIIFLYIQRKYIYVIVNIV